MRRTRQQLAANAMYSLIWLGAGFLLVFWGRYIQEDLRSYLDLIAIAVCMIGVLAFFVPGLRVFLQRQFWGAKQTPDEEVIRFDDLLQSDFDRVAAECIDAVRSAAEEPTNVTLTKGHPRIEKVETLIFALIPVSVTAGDKAVVEGACVARYSSPQWEGTPMLLFGSLTDAAGELQVLVNRCCDSDGETST